MTQSDKAIRSKNRSTRAERLLGCWVSTAVLVGALGVGTACSEPNSTETAAATTGGYSSESHSAAEPGDDSAGPAAEERPAAPDVDPGAAREVAPGVTVIPDPRIPFVPNVGIIEGSEAVLVVDTGLGERNGALVLTLAREIAGERRLYLTTTHFHPEHNFGASAFEGEATVIMNEAQAAELRDKGPAYIDLFKTFGEAVAERLDETRLIGPDRTYTGELVLDLGGREVVLREIPAHTRGDQLIWVPDVALMFAGDIAETRYFPIMPDADSSAGRWIGVLRDLEALEPEIVVPGHGAVAGPQILSALRLHIEFMRERVDALAAAGKNQQAITKLLVPAITAVYPRWGNENFLPFEIAILYAEATGGAPELPEF